MPNRILKESVCTSDTVARLSCPESEVLFYRLVVTVDDFGCYDGRANIILARCFPLVLDRVTADDVDRWLTDLARVGLLQMYEHDGKRYVALCKWDNHQRLRAKNRKWPKPTKSNLLSIDGQPRANDSNSRHEPEPEPESEPEPEPECLLAGPENGPDSAPRPKVRQSRPDSRPAGYQKLVAELFAGYYERANPGDKWLMTAKDGRGIANLYDNAAGDLSAIERKLKLALAMFKLEPRYHPFPPDAVTLASKWTKLTDTALVNLKNERAKDGDKNEPPKRVVITDMR